ncbi:MAG TPA: hypothetical protein VF603_15310 [Allosphingosinicella sp.]|jgi:hypothetical protein
MISNVILAALAVAGGAEKPVPLPTVIQCTLSLARAQAQSEQSPAAIADAVTQSCSAPLDVFAARARDPEASQQERDTNAALHRGLLLRLREMALTMVERERAAQ